MNLKTLHNLVDDVKAWSRQIPFEYDYVVGIHGSGVMVARILSAYTNKPMRYTMFGVRGRPLVVDDSLLSGKTMKSYKQNFPHVKRGVVYVKPSNKGEVDTYYEALKAPRIFEWNMFKSKHLENSMVDIDGVLCRDPIKRENDYDIRLADFYQTVKPQVFPTKMIKALVTSRLERYREITEAWLLKYGIKYEHLIMRQERGEDHSTYKGNLYRDIKEFSPILFIESSLKRAKDIASISSKPVLCYETMEMF